MSRAAPSGRILNHRYALRERTAAGGMAEVYVADDLRLGRQVAVKLLATESASDPAAVERFRREAQAAAGLSHPNVVAVYDWGTSDGTPFLVMEYVPGPDLRQLLRERGPLPEATALRLAADVAAALEAAHARGLVHRDVKPRNVLVGPDGRARLTDFGIARSPRDGENEDSQAIFGSAHYVSPEHVQGQPVDGRSDVYSLGALLYELLVGRPPFEGPTAAAVARQHLEAAAPSPRRLRPGISSETERIVVRALEKDPARRFPSAGAMRQALAAAAASLGGAAASLAADRAMEATQPIERPSSIAGERHPERHTEASHTSQKASREASQLSRLEAAAAEASPETSPEASQLDQPGAEPSRAASQRGGRAAPASPEASRKPSQASHQASQASHQASPVASQASHTPSQASQEASREASQRAGPLPGGTTTLEAAPSLARTRRRGTPLAIAGVALLLAVAAMLIWPRTHQAGVPSLAGQSLADARAAADSRGLKLDEVEQPTQETPAGVVVSQDPPPGRSVAAGGTVRVIVSSGVTVPDLVGQQCTAARAAVQSAGWSVRPVRWRVANIQDFGKIVAQEPAAGTVVPKAGEIQIQVAGPPRPPC